MPAASAGGSYPIHLRCTTSAEDLDKECGDNQRCLDIEQWPTFKPLFFFTNWNMSPPGAYSMAMARCVGVKKISLNWMT
jgi:hypothetical protein